MIAVAVLVWLVGGTTGTACQGSHLDRVARGVLAGKLSQVQKDDSEKDVRRQVRWTAAIDPPITRTLSQQGV